MAVRAWLTVCGPDMRRQFFRWTAADGSCGEEEEEEEEEEWLTSGGVERDEEPMSTGLEGPAELEELDTALAAWA